MEGNILNINNLIDAVPPSSGVEQLCVLSDNKGFALHEGKRVVYGARMWAE